MTGGALQRTGGGDQVPSGALFSGMAVTSAALAEVLGAGEAGETTRSRTCDAVGRRRENIGAVLDPVFTGGTVRTMGVGTSEDGEITRGRVSAEGLRLGAGTRDSGDGDWGGRAGLSSGSRTVETVFAPPK